MNRTIRVLLADCDALFGQRLAVELASEGIQVDTAATELELIGQLEASRGRHELVLIGELEDFQHERGIIPILRRDHPEVAIISLTTAQQAWQTDWTSDQAVYCTADRLANGRLLALVIKSAVRYKSMRQRSLELQDLLSTSEGGGEAKTEEQLYQHLYHEAVELLPGLDGFLIAHYDDQASEVSFPFAYSNGQRIQLPPRSGGKGIAEYVLLTKESLLLPYGDELFRLNHGLNPPDDSLAYCTSEMVVPMFLEGHKIHGAVFAFTYDAHIHYTREHLEVLKAFVNRASITIRNFIQLQEANQLRDATADLAGQRGRDGVLRAIVKGAHKIVNSDFTGLILQDEDGALLKAFPVIPETYFEYFGDPRQSGGLTRTIIETRRPMNIPDTNRASIVKESVRAAGVKSMLALPLIRGDRVLGVLFTHTLARRDFLARDLALWTAFATQAAGALDRVLEQERQLRGYQRLAMEMGRLEERLSLEETLLRVATVAKSVFDSETCRLFYIDPPTRKVMGSAWADGDQAEFHIESTPRPRGLTYHVLRTQQAYYYPDMADGPEPRTELLSAGLKSAAALPLTYGGRDIGVLHCSYFRKKPVFDEYYQRLFEAFGARAAAALNHAADEHKTNIWHGLDREIVNCTEVRQLYQLFTRRAHQALGADLSVFYPFDPISREVGRLPLDKECVRIGNWRELWRQPRGGRGGGVFAQISQGPDLLIINKLNPRSGPNSSRLARREGVRAFVAMRLEVILPDTKEPNLAGILFLNYRRPTALVEADLANLRSASELIAAGILRLKLQEDLQLAFQQNNQQLRAVIEIFRAQESKTEELNLDHIATHAAQSLGLDVCTILEFDPASQKFTRRGSFGLRHSEHIPFTLRSRFIKAYLHKTEPTVIADVQNDAVMRESEFVQREGICSTVVYPLWSKGESRGLLFGNYRHLTVPSQQALEAFALFADVAAHVVHQATLNSLLDEQQRRDNRRRLLVLVSMVHDMWQHTLVQKASAIRNYVFTLSRQLEMQVPLPEPLASVPDILTDIDHMATDISNAPPRMPTESEMRSDLVPIGSLLQGLAERELRSIRLRGATPQQIDVDVRALGGVQVRGQRRWLIYAFESLLQNCYTAMPEGGQITITGSRVKGWAEIRIRDTGRGVPVELRDKIFKAAISGRNDHKGLGIGSTLVSTLMEEIGGTIELEKPGPGDTTVLIRLPIGRQAKKG